MLNPWIRKIYLHQGSMGPGEISHNGDSCGTTHPVGILWAVCT